MVSKVIIVTGASRGIGLAVANYLVSNAHKVVLVSRSQKELDQIQAKFPSQVKYLAADLTNADVPRQVTELAIKSFGKIDGLVINHGVLSPLTKLADANVEDWKKLYDANFFSALALITGVIPHLRTSKGRVIFTSSGAAQSAYVSWGAYGSSKAALNSLARHLAVEEPDLAVVSVGPGRVDTDMQKELREVGKNCMAPKDYAGFVSGFENGTLNKPEWPGQVIGKLALEASPELAGKYFTWDSPELANYREQP